MALLPQPTSATVAAIYDAYEAQQSDGFRVHLGASIIGKTCDRAVWFDFRWVTRAHHSGRILRLFETGQREEARFVRNLRSIGVTVLEVDPETGRQFRVSAHHGHFGGSLDGIALGLPDAPKTWHVLEFKTHSAKSFAQLTAKGVAASKPQHVAQMQVYMRLMELTRALYLAVCKDTDALHAERIEADPEAGERLIARAGRIIDAARPPSRVSEDPAWFECRLCPHHGVCHGEAAPVKTCRSCLHATPGKDGWHCARHDQPLGAAQQRTGCRYHLFIPDLIPGDVIAVEDDRVTYRLADGAVWVNEARAQEASSC